MAGIYERVQSDADPGPGVLKLWLKEHSVVWGRNFNEKRKIFTDGFFYLQKLNTQTFFVFFK